MTVQAVSAAVAGQAHRPRGRSCGAEFKFGAVQGEFSALRTCTVPEKQNQMSSGGSFAGALIFAVCTLAPGASQAEHRLQRPQAQEEDLTSLDLATLMQMEIGIRANVDR
jgi:hypothetical protein